LLTTPKAIILGGGVMQREILYNIVRKYFKDMINGYIPSDNLESFIRPAICKDSGLLGAGMIR
jgi:hypothetical protein